MDPLSQAAFGASLSQSFANSRSQQGSALLIGALSGMAPDLDVFIRSADDPLLFLEFHRQITHSLIFIPFGALLCALIYYGLSNVRLVSKKRPRKRPGEKLTFAQIYLFAFLGYATHGLLDACTSYGTQLYWPFSDYRVAWNVVSIIDPLFTVPVIILVLLALFRGQAKFAKIGFAYAVLYLSLGIIQYQRADQALHQLASERGHKVERVHIKPSFGNRHLWKILYEYDGRYYVDAVRLIWRTTIIPGTSIQKLDLGRDFPWLPQDSQQARDVERFRWFSDDFLAVSPQDNMQIMDVRYSFLPNRINAMWGIELNRQSIEQGTLDTHVGYAVKRELDEKTLIRFKSMLIE